MSAAKELEKRAASIQAIRRQAALAVLKKFPTKSSLQRKFE
jgi:hypothetical protein